MHLARRRGRRSWYIRWTENRTVKERSTGTENKDEAEVLLKKFIHEYNNPSDQTSCRQILDRYARARVHVKSHRIIVDACTPLIKFFGELPATELNEQFCVDYVTWRNKANGYMRRELGVLRSACNLAKIKTPFWLPPESPPREKYLTKEESQGFLSQVKSAHIYLFTLIALATGARKTAILTLQWDRVDLARRIIDFNEPGREQTKKRRAICPIGEQLADALANTKATALTSYVIEWRGNHVNDIKKAFKKTAHEAGLPRI